MGLIDKKVEFKLKATTWTLSRPPIARFRFVDDQELEFDVPFSQALIDKVKSEFNLKSDEDAKKLMSTQSKIVIG